MGVYVTDNEIDFFRNQVKIAEHLREVSKTKQKEIDDLKEQILTFQSQMQSMTEQMMHDDRRFSAIIDEKNEAKNELRELQKRYDKLDEAYDNLVDENYAMKCEISDLVGRNGELNDKVQSAIKAKSIALEEMDNLRKELKSALEALHDQYDDSDKPCCKDCVFCRPVKGCKQPAFYCSKTCEYLYNNYAETYYCKEMIPYEDDYPF